LPQLADPLEHLDENFLAQFLRLGMVAQSPISRGVHGPLIPLGQLAESFSVSLLGGQHEAQLAGLGVVFLNGHVSLLDRANPWCGRDLGLVNVGFGLRPVARPPYSSPWIPAKNRANQGRSSERRGRSREAQTAGDEMPAAAVREAGRFECPGGEFFAVGRES
jgi:hypothetical protein